MTDRRDKLVFMKAHDSTPLDNRCCRATRKKNKRRTSKAIRQDVRRRMEKEVGRG
jgi:hypothetical protein